MPTSKEEKAASERITRSLDNLRVSYTNTENHPVLVLLSQRDKTWTEELEKYLKSNYSGEIINFLNAVRDLLDGKDLKHKLTDLIDRYIRENGEEQINISSSVRKEIILTFDKIQEEKGGYHLKDFQYGLIQAVDQMTQMIEMDIGLRFMTTPTITAHVEAEKKQYTALEGKLEFLKQELEHLGAKATPKARALLGINRDIPQLKKRVNDLELQFNLPPKMHEAELNALLKQAKSLSQEQKSRPNPAAIFTARSTTPTIIDSESSSPSSTPRTPSSKSSK